jgi:hypothetical protein
MKLEFQIYIQFWDKTIPITIINQSSILYLMEDLIRDAYPPQEKIFYLKKYLGGAARKALEGFFYSTIQYNTISFI